MVAGLVRDHWDADVSRAVYLPVGAGAHHWAVGSDDDARRWFATADRLASESRLRRAYESAHELAAQGIDFVGAPVPCRSGEVAVPAGKDHLLSLTEWTDGTSGPGAFTDDTERVAVTRLIGRLHRAAPPRGLPVWRPELAHRAALEAALADLVGLWETGRYGDSARTALAQVQQPVRSLLRRFDELAVRCAEPTPDWVVTHGEPHTANVLWTEPGPLLVDWESVALAPPERDLQTLLAGAASPAPFRAYVAVGGRAQPLDPDLVDLLELAWQLDEIGEYEGRFRLPHADTTDDRRCWHDLMDELPASRSQPAPG